VGEGPASPPAPVQPYRLSPPPPVRALAISAGGALLGAAGVVVASALGWVGWVLVLAGTLLTLAIVLAVVAVIATWRLRTTVLVGAGGITVRGGGTRGSLRWSEIDRVVQEGPHLVLLARGDPSPTDLVILRPRSAADPTFTALVEEVRARLDRDRGYRDLM
jgi:hypothetical protein